MTSKFKDFANILGLEIKCLYQGGRYCTGMYCSGTYTGIETLTFRTGLNTGRSNHTGRFQALLTSIECTGQ